MRGLVVCERAAAEDVPALVALDLRASVQAWTETQFLAVLSSERQDLLVLTGYGRHAGTTQRQVLAYCAFQILPPELEIHGLAVRVEHQRHGWGRQLLSVVLDRARRLGATRAWLEVRAGNARACALYGSAGFRQVAGRRGYYRDPPDDALILRSDLVPESAREEP